MCNEQYLNKENKRKMTTWLKSNNSIFVTFQIGVDKYIGGLTGAINKTCLKEIPVSESSFRTFVKSNTSSAKVKLAENKAKLLVQKKYNEQIMLLEREKLERQRKLEDQKRKFEEEFEYNQKRKSTEMAREQLEYDILEMKLSKLKT